MSTSLMTSRRFAPLFWCQAFSAFGDNFLKTALVFLILFQIGGANSEALITLAGATLIFPFFLLSGLGGELADRYDKALVARRLKLAEIGVAAVAVAGFAVHSIVLLFVAVGAYGTIASLFGPIKYGILPDHLERSELPSGNALVEGGTFLAILIGTIVAGLAAKDGGDPIHFAWLMMVSSVACWVASPIHSADRRRRAAPCHPAQHFRLHRRADQIHPRRAAAMVGCAGHQLVLAHRCAGDVAVAAAGIVPYRRQRRGRHRLPDHIFGRRRDWLRACRVAGPRPHYPVADAGRRRAARLVFNRSRLDHFSDGAGHTPARRQRILCRALQHPCRHRSCRTRALGRPVHRAGIQRGAGLGRRGSPRPCRRRRQRAQCRVHGRRRDRTCSAPKVRLPRLRCCSY